MAKAPPLGTRIRKLRLKADITLREMARRVGVSAAHMSDVEHGRRMPSDEVLQRIASELKSVGATYEGLRLLKPQLEDDLEEWVSKSSEVRQLFRMAKDSGLSAREMMDRIRDGLKEDS